MNGKYLLDTNIVIAFLAGESSVVEQVNTSTRLFYLSSTIIGELSYGAFKSNRTAPNLERIKQLQARLRVLSCDAETGLIYGQIKNQLRAKGRPLPENDI